MRTIPFVLGLAVSVLAHGESSRTPAPSTTGPQVFPTGGPTDSPTGPRGGPATTVLPSSYTHSWHMWWAYNREFILAGRLRGIPSSGVRMPDNDAVSRKTLREGELFDLMVVALSDKHHDVRAAAAIALGKFGLPEADKWLTKRSRFPGEGWYDVRESCIYAMGLLGLEENRRTFITIAGHKERAIKERSLALVGLLMDRTQDSADLLEWHLKFMKSGIRATAQTAAHRAEQERRRFAAHLLGFVNLEGYDNILDRAARGGRRWGGGEQGLAITALGRRRAPDQKESLFKMLYRRELDKDARRSVPLALGMMLGREDTDDIKRLARFIRDSKRDPVAQHFTIMALANIGGDQVVEVYEDLLRSRVFGSADDRAFVYLALGLVGSRSKKARDLLLAAYRGERSKSSRSVLAVACGLARIKDAVKLTLGYLDRTSLGGAANEGPYLAWGALALGLHGDARGLPVVRKIFKKYGHALVREKAAIALTLLERKAAVPELVKILKTAGTQHAKAAVVTALGLLPEPSREAVDALVDTYKDDSMPDSVRAMAIIALGALGDPRPVPLSALLTRHYNYFIRCLALDEIASYL